MLTELPTMITPTDNHIVNGIFSISGMFQLCRSEDVLDAIEQVQECITAIIAFASRELRVKLLMWVLGVCLLH